MNRTVLFVCGLVFVATSATSVLGQGGQPRATDWTQWRGPSRDAAVAGAPSDGNWPAQLQQVWKVDVGLGYATPLVVGDRIYVFARQSEEEVMTALNATTGAVVWKAGYPATFKMHPAATRHGPGPKSTPAYAQGRLFSIGMTGIVTAFDATSGKVLWQKPGQEPVPMYTTHAFSPLIDGGTVIFHIGGHDKGAITAFDVSTGAERWAWAGDGPSYGSPIVAQLEGTRQLITLTQKKLVGLDVSSGALLWERDFPSARFVNSATPVLYGNTVIVSNGGPATAVRIARRDGQWATEVAWENADAPYTFSNALTDGAVLVGLSSRNSGQYFGIDAASGKTLWLSEPRQATNAALLRSGNVVISLEDDGELVVAKSPQTAFEPLHRYRLSESPTWTAPVVAHSRLLVKDESTLISLGLK